MHYSERPSEILPSTSKIYLVFVIFCALTLTIIDEVHLTGRLSFEDLPLGPKERARELFKANSQDRRRSAQLTGGDSRHHRRMRGTNGYEVHPRIHYSRP